MERTSIEQHQNYGKYYYLCEIHHGEPWLVLGPDSTPSIIKESDALSSWHSSTCSPFCCSLSCIPMRQPTLSSLCMWSFLSISILHGSRLDSSIPESSLPQPMKNIPVSTAWTKTKGERPMLSSNITIAWSVKPASRIAITTATSQAGALVQGIELPTIFSFWGCSSGWLISFLLPLMPTTCSDL